MRAMRSIPFLPLIFLATTSVTSPPDPHAAIISSPIALDPSDSGRDRVGRLRYLGGWQLRSQRPDFGGISSMRVSGGEVLAVSDAGMAFRFRLGPDGSVSGARFAELPAWPGPGHDKVDRDSESLAFDPASGRLWIGFERHNQIWRYSPGLAKGEAHAAPPAMKHWPWNGGPEAMVRLTDGRFLIFCEDPTGSGDLHEVLLYAGDPTGPGAIPARFLYRAPPRFRVTDAAQLPDGRLLLLHRDFAIGRGISAALTIVDPGKIEAGTVLEGQLVARLQPPLTLDNMEALSIERANGRTILWIASDDNFNPLQRTLLMKFELMEEDASP